MTPTADRSHGVDYDVALNAAIACRLLGPDLEPVPVPMSRRSHGSGRGRHGQPGRSHREIARPSIVPERPAAPRPAAPPPTAAAEPSGRVVPEPRPVDPPAMLPPAVPPLPPLPPAMAAPVRDPGLAAANGDQAVQRAAGPATQPGAAPLPDGGCTAPQLRRFIKSRAYVPMHELRRRFGINGAEDDVTQIALDAGHVYVGLPQREGRLLGDLLRAGEVGYELSLDPDTPVVVGIYPMRPVPRV